MKRTTPKSREDKRVSRGFESLAALADPDGRQRHLAACRGLRAELPGKPHERCSGCGALLVNGLCQYNTPDWPHVRPKIGASRGNDVAKVAA